MAIRKAKENDEVGLQPRDAKGRFASKKARPIKPLPVNMKPVVEQWSTEGECNCGGECRCKTKTYLEPVIYKFNRLQTKLNPKKECKDVFEEAHRCLIASGGMLSKVIDRTTNKPYGYLIRIPSSKDPNVIYMRFVKHDEWNPNTYFQKANAIISTLICGERWLEKRKKTEQWIDDIPFCIYYLDTKNFLHVSDFGITAVQMPSYLTYVQGRVMNEAERAGYTLNDDMIDYITKFERKAHDYYKNNGKNKVFVALPFT